MSPPLTESESPGVNGVVLYFSDLIRWKWDETKRVFTVRGPSSPGDVTRVMWT